MKFDCHVKIGKFRERKVFEGSGQAQVRAEIEQIYGKGSLISCTPLVESPKYQVPEQKPYFPNPPAYISKGKQVSGDGSVPKLDLSLGGVGIIVVIVLVIYIIEKIF
jgi:hypothetical protein